MPLHRRYLQEKSHGGGAHPEPPQRAPDKKFTGNRVQITKDYLGYQIVDSKVYFSSLMDSQIKLCVARKYSYTAITGISFSNDGMGFHSPLCFSLHNGQMFDAVHNGLVA
jgi:hypothetical protein